MRYILRMQNARWEVLECDENLIARLCSETGENPIVVRCLINRGKASAEEIRQFLNPTLKLHLHAPDQLRDMKKAVERLKRAIQNSESIMIVTDFDVDGTTSSVIISQTLRLLGAKKELISCYIPDRFTEGYGLSQSIIEKAARENFKVIVTADIGIKSHKEADLAAKSGIDLIICDHHLPDGEDVPAAAYAVLCPKGSSGVGYPNKNLAACGVSLKLADALLEGNPKHELLIGSLAKLTAIGTIADMVDLSELENRAIVTHGLKALGEVSKNPGLRALMSVAQVTHPVTTYDVSFKLGPRINAAGRITHANSVLELFDARDDGHAVKLAKELDALNSERRDIQSLLFENLKSAMEQTSSNQPDNIAINSKKILVFAGTEAEGFHRGVVGIVCSKFIELTGCPTFICAINDEGMAHGSARSVNGFHIVDAMDSVSDLLVKYGGHPMAAGFTIKAENIKAFAERLNDYALNASKSFGKVFKADAIININDATIALIQTLARLEPHGIGNPKPLFMFKDAPLTSIQVLKEKHLKLVLGNGAKKIEALWWNSIKYKAHLESSNTINIIGQLEINEWNKRQTPQIKVTDCTGNQ